MRSSSLPLLVVLSLSIGAISSLSAQEALQGSLFTSPEQRDYLDYLRRDFLAKNKEAGFNIEASDIPDIPVDGTTSPAGPTEYTLGGIMRRGDGRLTIWLNNQSLTEAELPSIASLVRDGNTLALRFATANGTQLLRPGQTIEVGSGIIQERYQRPKDVDAASTSQPAALTEETSASDDGAGTDAQANQATEVAPTEDTSTPSDSATIDADEAIDASSLVDKLPVGVLENPEVLDSVIESLQAKRDSLSDAADE